MVNSIKIYLRLFLQLYRALVFKLRLEYKKATWRTSNSHNHTSIGGDFDTKKVNVGIGTYGILNVREYGNPLEKLTIGNYVSIASDVTFVLGGNHQLHAISTYPIKSLIVGAFDAEDAATKGEIVLEDESWIGFGATILSGVTIGKGAIVGAGALVAKSIDPYAVVVGNPAKEIFKRLAEDEIQRISGFSLSSLTKEEIVAIVDSFYKTPHESFNHIEKIIDGRINNNCKL